MKFIINDLAEVPGSLREHYVKAADGTFTLVVDGHPDAAKLSQFRSSNIELLKERDALKAKFEGIDPDEHKTLKARAAGDPDDVVKLKLDLASEKAGRVDAQQKADRAVFTQTVSGEFLRVGGRPEAADFMVAAAEKVFAVNDGALTTDAFSPSAPGSKLTMAEWMDGQLRAAAFAFKPSTGGGAAPSTRIAHSNGNELRDPTPQQLGQHAGAIARGELKIVHSE